MTDTLLTREVEAIPEPAPRRSSSTLHNGLISAAPHRPSAPSAPNGSDDTDSMFTQAGVTAEMISAGDLLADWDKWDEKTDSAANVDTGALDKLTESIFERDLP